MSDILHPDIPALVEKWKHVLDVVLPLNKWDTDREIAWLCEAASRADSILEIGSYSGVSTKAMALANPAAHISCLDLWEEEWSYEAFKKLLKLELETHRVSFRRGPSNEGLRFEPGFRPTFGFAFIDGGHTEDLVRADIEGTLPMMLPGSIISGHDFRVELPEDGVTKSVRELLPNHVVVVDSIWADIVP